MAIDRIQQKRDDIRKANEHRATAKASELRQQLGRDFASKYQAQINQLKDETKTQQKKSFDQKKEGSKEQREQSVIENALEAFGSEKREKESFQAKRWVQSGDLKKTDKEENVKKKEEEKKPDSKEGNDSQKTRLSGEGHKRVESNKSSDEREGRGSGGGGSQGGNQNSSGGEQDSSGGGGSSFSSSSQGGGSFSQPKGKGLLKKSGVSGREIVALKPSEQSGSGGSHRQFFSKENFQVLVKAVRLCVGHNGNTELDIEMNDEFFNGLRIKANKGPSGIVITFCCPNKQVYNLFLKEKFNLYTHLRQEKNIPVLRVDIE